MNKIKKKTNKRIISFIPLGNENLEELISLAEEALPGADSEEIRDALCSFVFDEDEEKRSFEWLALKMALEKLPPEEKKLITLRYFRDFSQVEVARIMGLSQVKVSREEKKILARLKKELI